jgi:hypothetical protein
MTASSPDYLYAIVVDWHYWRRINGANIAVNLPQFCSPSVWESGFCRGSTQGSGTQA